MHLVYYNQEANPDSLLRCFECYATRYGVSPVEARKTLRFMFVDNKGRSRARTDRVATWQAAQQAKAKAKGKSSGRGKGVKSACKGEGAAAPSGL